MNLSKNPQPAQEAISYQLSAIKKLTANSYNLKTKKGFTIIELLVVITIIGIVSGIIVASINSAKAKGRDAKRIADISVIQLALERYYDDPANKKYPSSLSVFDLDSSVPKIDPSGNNYSYSCVNLCQSYALNATLELSNGILNDDAIPNNGLIYDVEPQF